MTPDFAVLHRRAVARLSSQAKRRTSERDLSNATVSIVLIGAPGADIACVPDFVFKTVIPFLARCGIKISPVNLQAFAESMVAPSQ